MNRIASVMLICLAACANEQRVADLERRVKTLEDQNRQKNTEQPKTSTIVETGAVTASQPDIQRLQVLPQQQPQTPAPRDVEVVSIEMQQGESNSSWTRFSYLLKVRNNSSGVRQFNGDVIFTDAAGFSIDETPLGSQTIEPQTVKEVTGYALIRPPGAYRVSKVKAELK